VAICRVAQMGLLRLLTNPKVLGTGAQPIRRAWAVSNEVLTDKRVFFASEPAKLEAAWATMMDHPAAGHTSWTDANLAAFARQFEYEMVTFDHGFRRVVRFDAFDAGFPWQSAASRISKASLTT
jgi:uncharacterized protein